MKLLTKEIEKKAHDNYKFGSDMNRQMVVAKFFNPLSNWYWYVMNIDPSDNDYCWGIVKGFDVEAGSFSISELQEVRLPLGLSIERDKFFKPMPAIEVWNKLNNGEHV